MSSFGDKLRQERVSRGVSLDEISGATGVDRVFLEALEENRFELLTGPAFGKLYIRAYAAVLGFDPTPLIEDYDRERYGRAREQPSTTRVRVRPEVDEEEDNGNGAKPAKAAEDRAAPDRAAEALSLETPTVVPPPPEKLPETPAVAMVEGPVPHGAEGGDERVTSRESPRWMRALLVLAASFFVVLVLAWAAKTILGGSGEEARPAAAEAVPEDAPPGQEPLFRTEGEAEPESPTAGASRKAPGRAQAPAPAPETAAASEPAPGPAETAGARLSVAEHGVGLRVVDHHLRGEGDRFAEGTAVFFFTRVLGGRAGESVRHVWLREGGVVQTVELPLGGPHWRTHSRKTLYGLGDWTVEARDGEGVVLARAAFTCVPARP
jgi:transcriptional regulator with XRE-family HTH domain